MTLSEVIPIIESLSHADKFKAMQFLLAQLAKEEGIPLQLQTPSMSDPLWNIIGMAEGEDAAIAGNHDKHLYDIK